MNLSALALLNKQKTKRITKRGNAHTMPYFFEPFHFHNWVLLSRTQRSVTCSVDCGKRLLCSFDLWAPEHTFLLLHLHIFIPQSPHLHLFHINVFHHVFIFNECLRRCRRGNKLRDTVHQTWSDLFWCVIWAEQNHHTVTYIIDAITSLDPWRVSSLNYGNNSYIHYSNRCSFLDTLLFIILNDT